MAYSYDAGAIPDWKNALSPRVSRRRCMPIRHTLCYSKRRLKYFAWDDAKNEKLKGERGVGFERRSSSISSAVTCWTSWSTRTRNGMPAKGSSSSSTAITCTWYLASRTRSSFF